MSKNAELEVRLHSQEREWLLRLGNGNILEGIRNLIERAKDRRMLRDDSYYLRSSSRKTKWWDK